MKHIEKGPEPSDFRAWKATDKMSHRPNWNRVDTGVKNGVHAALMIEQGFICCYCEARIDDGSSHVEHFRPRNGSYSHLQLEYSNLHCSCGLAVAQGEPTHCGHRKGNWFDEELLVSPLDPGCESRFRFTGDGQVHPADGDEAAATTISRLALDMPKLRALRAAALDGLHDLPESDVDKLLSTRDSEGRFLEFHTAVRDVLLSY